MSLYSRLRRTGPAGKLLAPVIDTLVAKINELIVQVNLNNQHITADTTSALIALDVSDLAAVILAANDIKAKYNAHIADTDFHISADATNAIAAVNATDQGTLDTLLNEIQGDFNAHLRIQAPHVSIKSDLTLTSVAAVSSDLATAQTLATELHGAYTIHIANTNLNIVSAIKLEDTISGL